MKRTIDQEHSIALAKEALQSASALLITAGAGMGVDSGLPDFRGKEGFWEAYPPIARLGLSFTEMADPRWFRDDPELAWGFYGHRLHLYRSTTPHVGFTKLLELGGSKRHGVFVCTSNVDGQFQKAGFDAMHILEMHGSIHHLQCTKECSGLIWDATDVTVQVDETTFRAQPPLPRCPKCHALARPNILMFGDWGWLSYRSDEQQQRFKGWMNRIFEEGGSLCIVEIGAGKDIPTIRRLSEHTALTTGSRVIRINPRDSEVPHRGIALEMRGLEGIMAVCG